MIINILKYIKIDFFFNCVKYFKLLQHFLSSDQNMNNSKKKKYIYIYMIPNIGC